MAKPPTVLELAILGLLSQQSLSGYDLRKIFASSPMGHYSNSPGAIYPALRRLERRGLVIGREDRVRSMRPRRLFRTTRSGDESLLEWTSRSVTRDDVALRMNELALRFAFMEVAGAQVARRFLSSLADEIDAHVEHLELTLSEMEGSAASHGRLALQMGIDTYRAQGAWARGALEVLESDGNQETGGNGE